jgi:hypothetical protein
LLHQNRHVTCTIRHDFQLLAPLCHSTDADFVLNTQQTLAADYVPSTTKMLKNISLDFITVFPYILWHLLPCKKAPCVETATVCPSTTRNRWLHRLSIFMKCCVGFRPMCCKCRECVGLVQISSVRHILVAGIKEFPPELSIFVVICGCDSLQEKHKRSQSQGRTVYFV